MRGGGFATERVNGFVATREGADLELVHTRFSAS